MKQKTVKSPAAVRGIGLHSGRECAMEIAPAPVDSGISFATGGVEIPALWSNVTDTRLSTPISAGGASVSTIEHVMAALFMRGVTNARVNLSGAEIPIVDGSAKPLVDAIEAVEQEKDARVLRVLKTVRAESGDSLAMLEPADSLSFDVSVEYPKIPRQDLCLAYDPDAFIARIAPARTFCMWSDVLLLWLTGRARGGRISNAAVVGPFGRPIGGWKFPGEAVAHKTLDAVGDLYTSGFHVVGKFSSRKGGHGLHSQLLRALFSDESNYSIE